MTPKEVREILREWGLATVNRYCYSHSERSTHKLQQARDMAPGTKERAAKMLMGRDGTDRRRLMAAAAGVKGMDVAPMWSCDPIRASNDADHPHERAEIAVDVGIPEGLIGVDRAVTQLARRYPLRGSVVRTEYTVSAKQAAKVRIAVREFEKDMARLLGVDPKPEDENAPVALTLRQYRLELDKALEWLSARIGE